MPSTIFAWKGKKYIASCFYGTNESDYRRAWDTLDRRHGYPFKIRERFPVKLDKWQKVGQKDGAAIQKYSDFLRSLFEAMSHIKSFNVVNDCKENR